MFNIYDNRMISFKESKLNNTVELCETTELDAKVEADTEKTKDKPTICESSIVCKTFKQKGDLSAKVKCSH